MSAWLVAVAPLAGFVVGYWLNTAPLSTPMAHRIVSVEPPTRAQIGVGHVAPESDERRGDG